MLSASSPVAVCEIAANNNCPSTTATRRFCLSFESNIVSLLAKEELGVADRAVALSDTNQSSTSASVERDTGRCSVRCADGIRTDGLV